MAAPPTSFNSLFTHLGIVQSLTDAVQAVILFLGSSASATFRRLEPLFSRCGSLRLPPLFAALDVVLVLLARRAVVRIRTEARPPRRDIRFERGRETRSRYRRGEARMVVLVRCQVGKKRIVGGFWLYGRLGDGGRGRRGLGVDLVRKARRPG